MGGIALFRCFATGYQIAEIHGALRGEIPSLNMLVHGVFTGAADGLATVGAEMELLSSASLPDLLANCLTLFIVG
ncbi:hypothetical protein KAM483_16680 [Aeromonas caviae]|nr:hypothetical protein KAM473_19390 [Aeromonas caviae]GKR86767.1 hypothetical protein KAM483_16680 [Aeromonas caviae]